MSQREITAIEASVARTLRSSITPLDSLDTTRSLVREVISAYWKETQAVLGSRAKLREFPSEVSLAPLEPEVLELARKMGTKAAELEVLDASYRIGVLYTGLMPDERRARLGAHYTPRALCQRLLDMADEAGVKWDSARVLDPACGGGAFLSPIALRMAASLKEQPAEIVLSSIEQRLRGYEIDPFAAWMSQVFLDVTLAALCLKAGKPLTSVVQVCDALEQEPGTEKFNLVIGNPPYGRITLSPNLRQKFQRSLFGHANLYGVFADLALRHTSSSGVIAYVTPTCFLSGEYFKALRVLLGWEAPPVSIDFIAERKDVFADVLQETLLATYQRDREPGAANVHFLTQDRHGSVTITGAGSFNLPEELDRPWLIPRSERQSDLVGRVSQLPYRLADYGYTVSTGPLVWNRHKSGLRDEPGEGRYPLLWAESVRSNGVFEFRAQKTNHKPYFEPGRKEHWVVTDHPCVLLQRTTAKEQCRRLIAARTARAVHQQAWRGGC